MDNEVKIDQEQIADAVYKKVNEQLKNRFKKIYESTNPTALRSCPFCGAQPVLWEDDRVPYGPYIQQRVYGVMCTTEGCIMHSQSKYFKTEASAKVAWNRRTPIPPQDELWPNI